VDFAFLKGKGDFCTILGSLFAVLKENRDSCTILGSFPHNPQDTPGVCLIKIQTGKRL